MIVLILALVGRFQQGYRSGWGYGTSGVSIGALVCYFGFLGPI